jgi:hypothetical protein
MWFANKQNPFFDLFTYLILKLDWFVICSRPFLSTLPGSRLREMPDVARRTDYPRCSRPGLTNMCKVDCWQTLAENLSLAN